MAILNSFFFPLFWILIGQLRVKWTNDWPTGWCWSGNNAPIELLWKSAYSLHLIDSRVSSRPRQNQFMAPNGPWTIYQHHRHNRQLFLATITLKKRLHFIKKETKMQNELHWHGTFPLHCCDFPLLTIMALTLALFLVFDFMFNWF